MFKLLQLFRHDQQDQRRHTKMPQAYLKLTMIPVFIFLLVVTQATLNTQFGCSASKTDMQSSRSYHFDLAKCFFFSRLRVFKLASLTIGSSRLQLTSKSVLSARPFRNEIVIL